MNANLLFNTTVIVSVAAHGALAFWMRPHFEAPQVNLQAGKTSIRLRPSTEHQIAPAKPSPQLTPTDMPRRDHRRFSERKPIDRRRPVERIMQRPQIPIPRIIEPLKNELANVSTPNLEKHTPQPHAVEAVETRPDVNVAERETRPSPKSEASRGAVDSLPSPLAGNPAPPYPHEALQAEIEGRVMLRVTVGANGQVLELAVHGTSGSTVLDQSALATVRDWMFTPARRKGIAVDYQVYVPVVFKISDRT